MSERKMNVNDFKSVINNNPFVAIYNCRGDKYYFSGTVEQIPERFDNCSISSITTPKREGQPIFIYLV